MGRTWRRAQPQGPAPRQFLTRQTVLKRAILGSQLDWPILSAGPSRSPRSMSYPVRERRGTCSSRLAVAWGTPSVARAALSPAIHPLSDRTGVRIGEVTGLVLASEAGR